MVTLVLRRLAATVPLVLVVSFLVFLMIDFVPGDPALRLAGEHPTPERVEQVREQLHLDDPLLSRYASWLSHAATGDFGRSFTTEQPVGAMLRERLGVTASLILVSVVLMAAFGAATGVAAAIRPGGAVDRAVTGLCSLLVAVPSFWLALLLVTFFAVGWQLLRRSATCRRPKGSAHGCTTSCCRRSPWPRHRRRSWPCNCGPRSPTYSGATTCWRPTLGA